MIDTILMGLMLAISVMLFLYGRALGAEADRMKEAIQRLSAENEAIRSRMRVYEKRLQMREDKAEKLVIAHEYVGKDDSVQFGEF